MPRKPISIWIAQILIALVGLVGAAGFAYSSIVAWPVLMRAGTTNPAILVFAGLEMIVKLAVFGFIVWTLLLISRRSPLGRWFGLFWLALILGLAIYAEFNPSPSSSSWQLPLENDAQRAGAFVGQMLAVALYLTLMVRFGFSRASRAFFARPQVAS